jgi:hypothetical protein
MDPVGDSLDANSQRDLIARFWTALVLAATGREKLHDPLVLGVCSNALFVSAHGFLRAEQFELQDDALPSLRLGTWETASGDPDLNLLMAWRALPDPRRRIPIGILVEPTLGPKLTEVDSQFGNGHCQLQILGVG